ncbi:aspartic peptidase domain-containing protein [Lasiosphaeria miniovina]|uniref:Aspartic peptidase domain-containing protein n=1 Tax=Lasiosphaeria miniovina TaxID=1954250 RepID=A0AA40AWK5_9PEZI|nr:aspartic peptidase domain-containing protein [Lasiosphaeria miniovina]KAK0723341.1 aspartic peptidase domain-containing protein [Lasiosphaeria miniovina]
MAPSTAVLAAAGCFAVASALHAQSFPGASVGHGFISIPVSADRRAAVLAKRDGSGYSDVSIQNLHISGYTIQIEIGTPPQTLDVAVDTGSVELWVNPNCDRSSLAKNETVNGQTITYGDSVLTDPAECRKRGRYDASKSSTVGDPKIPSQFIVYGGQTTANIDYVSDKISIGGLSVDSQIFGAATDSNQTGIGIMGFGPARGGYNNSGTYPLFLTQLAKSGAIASPAFSLDLRDLDNATGSIVFGGVDKKKYMGALATIPFQTVSRKYSNSDSTYEEHSYYLTVKSMTLVRPDGSTKGYDIGGSFLTSLDCGSANNLLPVGVASAICSDLNGTVTDSVGSCSVDCAARQRPGGVTFGLDGKDILLSYENMIEEFAGSNGQPSTCVVRNSDNVAFVNPFTGILGAPFLRSSYAVFDWGNSNLHIAQAADCGTNIVAIGNGTNSVPSGNSDCTSPAARFVAKFGLALGVAVLSGFALL